jgi:hypothetical protein
MLTVHFAAGVMGLAALLAAGPRVVVEVWHKERWVARGGRGTHVGWVLVQDMVEQPCGVCFVQVILLSTIDSPPSLTI